MAFIYKISEGINSIVEKIVIVLMAVLTILTTMGVVYRYVLGAPITWLHETTIVTFVWTVFFASSVAFKRGEHMYLEFLVNGASKKASRIMKIIIILLVMFFLIVIVTQGVQIIKQTSTQKYQTIDLSTAWFYASFPVSAVISLIHLVNQLIDLILNRVANMNIEDKVLL